jgi:hypothetical protein
MSETIINPELAAVIRANLAATREWEWNDEDRAWAAERVAYKHMTTQSGIFGETAHAICMALVIHIMKEGEPVLSYCVHCHGHHDKAALENGWKCPLA